MTHNPHRAQSRLASFESKEWDRIPAPRHQRETPPPGRLPPPDHDEETFSFEDGVYHKTDHAQGACSPDTGEFNAINWSGEPQSHEARKPRLAWQPSDSPAPMKREPTPESETKPYRAAMPAPYPSDSGELTMQQRYENLMHTIKLYDEWKLGGIRAHHNRLQAYLTPYGKKLELKEAIAKNQVLIISIDHRGNTDVKEPKCPGPWQRLTAWLFGGQGN